MFPSVSARLLAAVPNGVTKFAKICRLMDSFLREGSLLRLWVGDVGALTRVAGEGEQGEVARQLPASVGELRQHQSPAVGQGGHAACPAEQIAQSVAGVVRRLRAGKRDAQR